jgi:hypothetical protein
MGYRDPATTMRYIIQRPKDQAEVQEWVAQAVGFWGVGTVQGNS